MWKKIDCLQSTDANVAKYVFTSNDSVAEAVLYKYPTYNERTVMCISTQSGCPVGCRFCGAGDFFVRSLTSDEIVGQVEHMMAHAKIIPSQVQRGQIMFMSMGEPLLNYPALRAAIIRLESMYPGFALLISTIGPAVKEGTYNSLLELSVEVPSVGLQFSIHEPWDRERNTLIPFKAKLSLDEIASYGERWHHATGRKPFINYCAHDKNDTEDHVDALLERFNPMVWEYTVSVVCEREESVAAANARQRALASTFMGMLVERGASVRMFDPAGQDDIGGGCGQLFHVQRWAKENPDKLKSSIGAKLPIVHCPV